MRAVVIEAQGQIRVDTVADPSLPGPDGAVIAVTTAAICGSDLHFYEGDCPLPVPVPLGHEAVGTVLETGPDVRTVRVGYLVLVSSVAGCGACEGCATADPITCLSGPQVFGAGALGGAQAELIPLIQSGRLDTSGIFTDTLALDDAAAAYAAVAARSSDCVKVALTP